MSPTLVLGSKLLACEWFFLAYFDTTPLPQMKIGSTYIFSFLISWREYCTFCLPMFYSYDLECIVCVCVGGGVLTISQCNV